MGQKLNTHFTRLFFYVCEKCLGTRLIRLTLPSMFLKQYMYMYVYREERRGREGEKEKEKEREREPTCTCTIIYPYVHKVDIFSYSVMMIHVLSGTWPLPSEATQANPNNPDDPDDLIAVSEFNRRKESVKIIKQDHPLLPLIKQCVSNASTLRPTSLDVLQQVNDITNEYMTSFTNKVEMLQWIKTLETESQDMHGQIIKLKTES